MIIGQSRISITKTTQSDTNTQGGGGSAQSIHHPGGGGGYLDNYTNSGFKKIARDPRMDILREARIGQGWQNVAEHVGFDMLLEIMSILRDTSPVGEDHSYRIRVPVMTSILRVLRGRIIMDLHNKGLSYKDITAELAKISSFDTLPMYENTVRKILDAKKNENSNNLCSRVESTSG